MPEPVLASPARPPRYSLWASAPTLSDDARWQNGFEFQPESCGASGRLAVECEGNTSEMDATYGPVTVEGTPFLVWSSDKCSSWGFLARDWNGRARRALEATRSFEIAAELWTGSLSIANPALTDLASDTVTDGPTAEVAALACLEQGLARCYKGRQGMVHVTPQLLTHLRGFNVVELSGNQWVSPNGHLVVPDAGYDGSGPGGVEAGDSQWAYATGMVSLRSSEVVYTPGTLREARDFAAAMDRSVNDIVVFAQQVVAFQVDECCIIAAEVDLAVCAIAGVS